MKISPLAYVSPQAIVGEGTEVGPFCVIEAGVVVGKGNVLMNSVTLLPGARLGDNNTVFPGAVIGAVPQDLKFRGEETTAEVGSNNTIRENVTINRGTAARSRTTVGDGNLLMESVHVAHDASVGNGCIIGNGTKLAGETQIDDFAILSANVLLHQFCRVGGYTMVGGGTRSSQSILPFTMTAREPASYCGLNIVGLRRRGFSAEAIEQLHRTMQIIVGAGTLEDRMERVRTEVGLTKETEYVLSFVDQTRSRGFIR